jgi:hypothetical protein
VALIASGSVACSTGGQRFDRVGRDEFSEDVAIYSEIRDLFED